MKNRRHISLLDQYPDIQPKLLGQTTAFLMLRYFGWEPKHIRKRGLEICEKYLRSHQDILDKTIAFIRSMKKCSRDKVEKFIEELRRHAKEDAHHV